MPSRNRTRERRREARRSGLGPVGIAPVNAPNGAVRRHVPAGSRLIATPDEATALAAHLLDPGRTHPVAVISISGGQTEPWIDVLQVESNVRGIAEVVVLPTDSASWRLSEALPPLTQVYGGAGRVYPTGLAWTADPQLSPLRFAYGPADAQRAADHLIGDCLAMGEAAGAARDPRPSVAAAGAVVALIEPSRAIVRLADGTLATIWAELTAPGVALPRIVTVGQSVRGSLDTETRRLDVDASLTSGVDACAHYQRGDVVLARVGQVRQDVVHLALHPDVVVAVPRDRVTANGRDTLPSLFGGGETVVARVAWVEGGRPALRLDDIDEEDEPLPAPPLLDGGPGWLVEPDWSEGPADGEEAWSLSAASEALDAATQPGVVLTPPSGAVVGDPQRAERRSGAATGGAARSLSLTLDAARAEIRRLEQELDERRGLEVEVEGLRARSRWLAEERDRLLGQVARQKQHLLRRVQSAGKARRAADAVPRDSTARAFDDPLEQFQHEVSLEWADRFRAEEKAARPLASWTVGPDFLASLESVEGLSRRLVVRVVVEVLTGLADELAGRETHRLRTGRGGDDPYLIRDDGAGCFRVALQRRSPAARRLHYWKQGNQIELSRVVMHDDMRP